MRPLILQNFSDMAISMLDSVGQAQEAIDYCLDEQKALKDSYEDQRDQKMEEMRALEAGPHPPGQDENYRNLEQQMQDLNIKNVKD